jgi:hypothetical protein
LQRIEELFANVSERLSDLETDLSQDEELKSDNFLEVFRTCVETAAHTASEYKRQRVADFLAHAIRFGMDDLSEQFAEDLKFLAELHLFTLSRLPSRKRGFVSQKRPDKFEFKELDDCLYEKAISDLQRLGFITLDVGGGLLD